MAPPLAPRKIGLPNGTFRIALTHRRYGDDAFGGDL